MNLVSDASGLTEKFFKGANVKGEDGIERLEMERRVREILEETDPERQLALSRQLRAGVWDLMSEQDRARIREAGIDIPSQGSGLRQVK